MKKVFCIGIFILPFISKAQSKISYELMLNVSGVTNTSQKPTSETIKFATTHIRDSAGAIFLINPAGNSIYTVATPRENYLDHKPKLTPSFTFGGRLNYQLRKELSLSIGASISYLKASRIEKDNYAGSLAFTGSFQGFLVVADSLYPRTFNAGTYSYAGIQDKEQNYKFFTINVPISVSYLIKKWQLEGGIVPSVIINSKKEKEGAKNDPEILYTGEPGFTNSQKISFSLSVSPSYQVTKNIRIGLEYVHGLSPGLIKSYDVYKLIPRSLGLKIFYKIK